MDNKSQKNNFFEKAYAHGDKRIEQGYGWPLEVDPQVVEFLKEIKKTLGTGTALDLGCGEGRHTIHFAQNGFYAFGIDYIERALEEARQNAARQGIKNIRFVEMDVLKLYFPDSYFDIVLDWSVLDHIKPKDWSTYLFNIYSVLKSGGYLILTEFSANDERVKNKYNGNNFFEDDDHYNHHFKMDEIEKLFGKDFEIIESNETILEAEPRYLMLNVLLKKK